MLLDEDDAASPRVDPVRDEAVREMAAAMGYEFKKKRKQREDELDNVPSSLSLADIDRLLTMACEPSDVEAPLLPFVLLKRTRKLLKEDGWKRREAIERHIARAEDAGELCAVASALLYFPFARQLSSPNQLEALRLLLAERARDMADYVNSMQPELFYETQATVFERSRSHEKPERLFEKFDFVRFIGSGTNGAAFEVVPAAPPDARALLSARAALKVSRLEPAALDVHALLTKELCGDSPQAVFSRQRAYGIARLYYACDGCKLDVSRLPRGADPLGKWSEGDRFSVSAMELCDSDLHGWATLFPRQAVSEQFFAAVLAQLLCTLDTLSRWNFVHGDLYLKNVLLKRLSDYEGNELLHFSDQGVHVPAHLCSGYVAKIADFGLSYAGSRPDPKQRGAAFDVHTLACAWLSHIYCAVISRRLSLDEVPHRVVASLRAMVAPPEAFQPGAEWDAAFTLRCEASTEPDFLKRHEGQPARSSLAKRLVRAANALLRKDFDHSKGMGPADALRQLPLLEQFRQASRPQLARSKIVPVNS